MNKVIFDLSCPPNITPEQYYLDLIDYLVEELRKHTEVQVVNEDILTKHKEYNLNEEHKILFNHCMFMANAEEIPSMPEYFKIHPVEEMNLPEEKEESFKKYLREQHYID